MDGPWVEGKVDSERSRSADIENKSGTFCKVALVKLVMTARSISRGGSPWVVQCKEQKKYSWARDVLEVGINLHDICS